MLSLLNKFHLLLWWEWVYHDGGTLEYELNKYKKLCSLSLLRMYVVGPLAEDTVIILFNECELQIMFQNYKILEYVDSYEHIVGVCIC